MSKIDQWILRGVVLLIVAFLIFLAFATRPLYAQQSVEEPHPQVAPQAPAKPYEEPQPQVVLIYNHKQTGVEQHVAVVKKVDLILGLVPVEESHPAPMEHGTNMICRPHSVNGEWRIKCGADDFRVNAIRLQPDDKKTERDASTAMLYKGEK